MEGVPVWRELIWGLALPLGSHFAPAVFSPNACSTPQGQSTALPHMVNLPNGQYGGGGQSGHVKGQ